MLAEHLPVRCNRPIRYLAGTWIMRRAAYGTVSFRLLCKRWKVIGYLVASGTRLSKSRNLSAPA